MNDLYIVERLENTNIKEIIIYSLFWHRYVPSYWPYINTFYYRFIYVLGG